MITNSQMKSLNTALLPPADVTECSSKRVLIHPIQTPKKSPLFFKLRMSCSSIWNYFVFCSEILGVPTDTKYTCITFGETSWARRREEGGDATDSRPSTALLKRLWSGVECVNVKRDKENGGGGKELEFSSCRETCRTSVYRCLCVCR